MRRAAAAALLGWLAGAAPCGAVTLERSPLPEPGRIALLIQGAIVAGDAAKLANVGRRRPPGERVALIVLNSPGGSVTEARDMARLIHKLPVPVLVPANGVCASACFLLFAAATKREAEPGARIGVHSASVTGGRENLDTLGVTTLMAREAAAYGVPASITGRMVTTRPGDMAWLSADELATMGVRVAAGRAPSGTGEAGSAPGAVSDWTRGFRAGSAPGASCSAPDGVANAADWMLGCKSGQTSASVAAAGAAPDGGSEWTRGFERGRGGADCAAPPSGAGGDWALGCASGRRAGGG